METEVKRDFGFVSGLQNWFLSCTAFHFFYMGHLPSFLHNQPHIYQREPNNLPPTLTMVHQQQRWSTQLVKSKDIGLDPDSELQGLPQSATVTIVIVCKCNSHWGSYNCLPVFDPTAKCSSQTSKSNERTSKTIVLGILLYLFFWLTGILYPSLGIVG